jgi:hypothetical protein
LASGGGLQPPSGAGELRKLHNIQRVVNGICLASLAAAGRNEDENEIAGPDAISEQFHFRRTHLYRSGDWWFWWRVLRGSSAPASPGLLCAARAWTRLYVGRRLLLSGGCALRLARWLLGSAALSRCALVWSPLRRTSLLRGTLALTLGAYTSR